MLSLSSTNVTVLSTIRSNVESIDSSLVQGIISEASAALNVQVALATLLVYDTITNMDKEVKYFWAYPRSFVSLVYFSNRFIGLFGAIANIQFYTIHANEVFCRYSVWTGEISNFITILLINYLLLSRVVALFQGDRKIDIFLKVLFSSYAISGLSLLIYETLYQEVTAGALAEGVTICGTDRLPQTVLVSISWAIGPIYELILMILTFYSAAVYWKASVGPSGSKLVKILIQDQAIYVIAVVACSVGKIVNATIESRGGTSVLANILASPSLLCVLGSRLLVHLKEAGESVLDERTRYDS